MCLALNCDSFSYTDIVGTILQSLPWVYMLHNNLQTLNLTSLACHIVSFCQDGTHYIEIYMCVIIIIILKINYYFSAQCHCLHTPGA